MNGEDPTNWQCENCDFATRFGSITSGRLVFTADAAGVTILADPSIPELACGSFVHPLPHVLVEEGALTVQYGNFSLFNRLIGSHLPLGEVRLNPSIPWEIEFRGGVSNLYADLRGLALRSLDLLGGANQFVLFLSKPAKTTFIYVTGGIRNSSIRVPPSVGMRVQISGGANDLEFDHQRFDTIGGDKILENSAFKNASSRLEICIAGGANNVTIGD